MMHRLRAEGSGENRGTGTKTHEQNKSDETGMGAEIVEVMHLSACQLTSPIPHTDLYR